MDTDSTVYMKNSQEFTLVQKDIAHLYSMHHQDRVQNN